MSRSASLDSAEKTSFDTHGPTALFVDWLRKYAAEYDGALPEFSNAEAGLVMGLPDSHARHRGRVQSRLDFACYQCGLPPLGLAADEPYSRAWRSDDTGWQFPIEHMTYVVRNRQWTPDDFDRLEQTLKSLRPSAAKLWQDEIKDNPQRIKDWAFAFVHPSTTVQTGLVVKRNPDWSRDELILAFRLYMRHRQNVPAKSGVEVARLSRLLRHMAQRSTRSPSYRNTDGVYMKLMNFRIIDPEYTTKEKVGLKNNGKDELRVWELYANNLLALEAAADAIEAAINAPASETGINNEDEDDIEECEEGRILTRMHHYRERNRKLVALFKERFRSMKGRLECAGCELDFAVKYGAMAERLIDVHHIKPVHTMKPGDKTDPNDLVLLCVSCHRAVHSERQWLSVDELRRRLGKPLTT